jgi:hypothetical protein
VVLDIFIYEENICDWQMKYASYMSLPPPTIKLSVCLSGKLFSGPGADGPRVDDTIGAFWSNFSARGFSGEDCYELRL